MLKRTTSKIIAATVLSAAVILSSTAQAHAGDHRWEYSTERAPRTMPRLTQEQWRAKQAAWTEQNMPLVLANRQIRPVYYKVKEGQTLWRLAVTFRGDGHQWKSIAKANGITGTTIYTGQVLRVR